MVAQNVILSLLFQFVLGKEAMEVDEAKECQPLLDAFQLSLIPSVSIRSKAVMAILRTKFSLHSNFSPVEPTSSELEFVAEVLCEVATSESKRYLSFSGGEILQVYQELIASNPTILQVFEAFNVLDDEDFIEIQMSAERHSLQSESSEDSDTSGTSNYQLQNDFIVRHFDQNPWPSSGWMLYNYFFFFKCRTINFKWSTSQLRTNYEPSL